MTRWSEGDLHRIGQAEELDIAARKADSSLSAYTTIWAVRVDDGLYVRAAYGPESGWYRRARAAGTGRIRVAGVEHDVTFSDVPGTDATTHAALDAAYHTKYDQHGPRIVGTVVGPEVVDVTLRLEPLGT